MFYWSHRDTHLVLTDDEELNLVREVSDGPEDRVRYDLDRKIRRKIERRIFRYFERLMSEDPEEFRRRFVFRSCYGAQARMMFPAMLDAYGRITRRAIFGSGRDLGCIEELPENILYSSTKDIYQVALLGRGRWIWSKPTIIGRFSFPTSGIQKLAGTVTNFFLATDTVHIKFHRDFVRLSVLHSGVNSH
jgi:hypothetical protein